MRCCWQHSRDTPVTTDIADSTAESECARLAVNVAQATSTLRMLLRKSLQRRLTQFWPTAATRKGNLSIMSPQKTPTKAAAVTSTDPPSAKKTTPSKWQRVVASAVNESLLTKARRIAEQLNELYPNPPIPLDHSSTFQLLVAVMLSAQTTDLKVNQVTPELFKVAPDAAAMAAMQVADIQQIIQPIGLAPTKAKNLSNMSKLLLERHNGEVPSTFAELEALPGVGHKTASVVMSQAFGHSAFPVDTHIHRLATRWGLSNGKSVEQTEADLKALFPEHTWRDVHLQVIYFGREHCPAQRHDQSKCPVCSWAADCSTTTSSQQVDSNAVVAVVRRKATLATVAVVEGDGSVSAAAQTVDKPLRSKQSSKRQRKR